LNYGRMIVNYIISQKYDFNCRFKFRYSSL